MELHSLGRERVHVIQFILASSAAKAGRSSDVTFSSLLFKVRIFDINRREIFYRILVRVALGVAHFPLTVLAFRTNL